MGIITNELSSPYGRNKQLLRHNRHYIKPTTKLLGSCLARNVGDQQERKTSLRQLRRSNQPYLGHHRTPPNSVEFIRTTSPLGRLVNHHHIDTDTYLEFLQVYSYEGLVYAREFELDKQGKGNRLFRKMIHTPPK